MKKLAILCAFLITIGCSNENITEQESIKSAEVYTLDTKSNIDVDVDVRAGDNIICIEWVRGLKESQKAAKRNYYRQKELLLDWKICIEEEDIETWWWANKTEPIVVLETDGDVNKVTYEGNCCD